MIHEDMVFLVLKYRTSYRMPHSNSFSSVGDELFEINSIASAILLSMTKDHEGVFQFIVRVVDVTSVASMTIMLEGSLVRSLAMELVCFFSEVMNSFFSLATVAIAASLAVISFFAAEKRCISLDILRWIVLRGLGWVVGWLDLWEIVIRSGLI